MPFVRSSVHPWVKNTEGFSLLAFTFSFSSRFYWVSCLHCKAKAVLALCCCATCAWDRKQQVTEHLYPSWLFVMLKLPL